MNEFYKSKIIKEISPISNCFLISWHVTGWCNFHCPYCIDGLGKSKFTTISDVENVSKKINTFIENNINLEQPVKLRLYGGEPSAYPWINILNNIKRLDSLVMPTNFSNSLEYYKELYLYCNKRNVNFILNCSCHPEATDFVNKMIALTNWCREQRKLGIYLSEPINTFVIDDNFDLSPIKILENNNINKIKFTIKRDIHNKKVKVSDFWENKVLEYDEKYQNLIHSPQLKVTLTDGSEDYFINSTSLISKFEDGGFDPTGFYCNAGINSIAIETNGDVLLSRCDYLKSNYIGNIFDENFKLDKKTFKCELNKNDGDSRCALCFNTIIKKEN